MNSEQTQKPNRIAIIALLISIFTAGSTTYWQYRSNRIFIENDIRQHRQQALITALRVIDNVYHNVLARQSFGDTIPHLQRQPLNIQDARDAMNSILI